MKPLKIYFLQAAIVGMCAFSGCQNDELNSISPAASRNPDGTAVLNPPPPDDLAPHGAVIIPPSSVVKQEYAQATSWLVTWNNPLYDYRYSLACIFSTVDGSFQSYNSLNQSSPEHTAKADMVLLLGRIHSLKKAASILVHGASATATQLKRSTLSPLEFAVAVQNNPALFQQEFENSAYYPSEIEPNSSTSDSGDNEYYQTGQIYLFKTDRTPAVYGAIRIVDATNVYTGTAPRVIQIVVYRNNTIVVQKNKKP